jgi:hypothetical protein
LDKKRRARDRISDEVMGDAKIISYQNLIACSGREYHDWPALAKAISHRFGEFRQVPPEARRPGQLLLRSENK